MKKIDMKKSLFLLLVLCSITLAQTEIKILPKATDNSIDNWLEEHYVYVDRSIQQKSKLFFFLPGSGVLPSQYKEVLKNAALNGYKAIGLRYPNTFSVANLCSQSPDSACYEKVRLEVLDGTNREEQVNVNRANSIENRLIKLLQFLKSNYPNDGWDQFITSSNNPVWDRIIVSGHSLGGGMAAIIAKQYKVSRSVMFAAPTDYSNYFNRPAFWLGRPGQTDTSLLYAFSHSKDGIEGYRRIWEQLGLNKFGTIVNTDNSSSPYNGSHMLSTNLNPASTAATDYHGSVVSDAATPKDQSGNPLLREVWNYISFYPEAPTNVSETEESLKDFFLSQNFPNPFNPSTIISYSIPNNGYVKLLVFNILGKEVKTLVDEHKPSGKHSVEFNATNLPSGIYIYTLEAGGFRDSKKLLLLK